MGEAWANLSGSGNQQVYGRVWRVAQEWGNNRTLFEGYIQYLANGYGSWTGSAGYWQASAPGLFVSGNWTIPYANRNDSPVLWQGQWWVGHDGAGNLGAFTFDAHINYNAHSSIGSGTANAYEPPAPRIPKRPSEPRDVSVSNIGPKNARINFIGPADDRGSGVDQYQMLISENPNPEIGWIVNRTGITSSPQDVDTLDPAKQYYVKLRAHNGAADNGGWGDWSATVPFKTLSGGYVGVGGGFPGVEILVGKGGSYVQVPEVRIGKDDTFVLAS